MSEETPTTTTALEAAEAPQEAPKVDLASVMTPQALAALEAAGIAPDHFRAPKPPELATIGLEQLMGSKSNYPRAQAQTKPMVYVGHHVDRDSAEFEDYLGVIYVQAIHPDMGAIVISHAYARSTGELMPVTEWVTEHLTKGDVFCVASILTRSNRTVYRPIDPAGYPAA